jgi:hypothetical protein
MEDTLAYPVPVNFVVDVAKNGGYTVIQNVANGQGSMNSQSLSGSVLTIKSVAPAHACYNTPMGRPDRQWNNGPGTIEIWKGEASQTVRVHLRSSTPTEVVGTQKAVMITTRGLNCCGGAAPYGIVKTKKITTERHSSIAKVVSAERQPGELGAREANDLGEIIRAELVRASATAERTEARSFIDTDLFASLLHASMLGAESTGSSLAEPAATLLSEDDLGVLRETFGDTVAFVTRHDLASHEADALATLTGLDVEVARSLRLRLLGLPTVSRTSAS